MDPYPPAAWEDDLQYRGTMGDMSVTHWHRFLLEFHPTPATDTADYAYMHWDVAKVTNGAIDGNWAQADFDAVNSAIEAFISALGGAWSSIWTYVGHKAYRKGFNSYAAAGKPENAHDNDPNTVWAPFADSGAAVRTVTSTHPGTSTAIVIPQMAATVTNRNVKRRGWGRFYFPGFTGVALDAGGGLTDSAITLLLTTYQTAINSMASANMHVVTPTTTNQAAGQAKGVTTAAFGLLQVSRIQVDSTADVQRRRRHHVTRKISSLP